MDKIIVNGAWYVDQFPTQFVIELADGSLKFAPLSPLEPLTALKLKAYNGYHPRKMKGNPVPEYLYKFYGIEKNAEGLSEVIRLRITPTEKAKFEAYVSNLETKQNVSDVLREFIRSKI